jgi:hypothetical protein
MIVIFSVMVSLVYGSHHFFVAPFLDAIDEIYYPMTLEVDFDASTLYASRAQSAYSGQLLLGDISLSEYVTAPATLPLLPGLLMGGLTFLTGSLKNALVISDFLFPTIIYLMVYAIFYELTKRKILSLFVSSLFIFAPLLSIHIPPFSTVGFTQIIKDLFPVLFEESALFFHRFDYPKITFIFIALTYYLILRAISHNKKITTWLAGISFGILFYTYLFDWVYVFISLVIMIILFLLYKKNDQAKQVFTIFLIGIAISIGYWINYFQLHQLAQYNDIFLRAGVDIGHEIGLQEWKNQIRALGLITILWFLGKQILDKRILIYITSFLVPYLIVENVQVILGFNPAPDHWFRELYLPASMALVMIILLLKENYAPALRNLFAIPSSGRSLIPTVTILLLISYFSFHLYSQYIFSATKADAFSLSKETVENYEWLNSNTPRGSVVGAFSLENNTDLLIHTHNKVFVPRGLNTIASNEEIIVRLTILAKIFQINPPEFTQLLKDEEFYYFGDYYFDRSVNNTAGKLEMSEEELRNHLERYTQYIPPQSLKDLPFVIDYIYYNKSRDRKLAPTAIDPVYSNVLLEEVYQEGDVTIYKVL